MEPTKTASFQNKLLDFCFSRTVEVEAIVEEDTNDRHYIVFGRRFCQEHNMIFYFKYTKITWEDLSIPINKSKNQLSTLCIEDEELPKNIGIETNRVSRAIIQMNTINIITMIW